MGNWVGVGWGGKKITVWNENGMALGQASQWDKKGWRDTHPDFVVVLSESSVVVAEMKGYRTLQTPPGIRPVPQYTGKGSDFSALLAGISSRVI